MKNYYFACMFIFIFAGCTFFEPSTLVIRNESKYPINITPDKGNRKNLLIEDNAGDFLLTTPGDIKLSITIDEIRFKKEYNINLNFQEKKKFSFKIE
jgi:hypothetical protein